MAWWIWVVIGAVLLAAEAIIATDFYLVFLGISGITVGLLALFGLQLPAWAQFLVFALIAVILLVLYRRSWKPRLTVQDREMGPELVGEVGMARVDISSGARGRVDLRGAIWEAINDGESAIEAGSRCEVLSVDGLTLRVRSENRP
jgi:membrane protein implicated in regulation of membrane protease activity